MIGAIGLRGKPTLAKRKAPETSEAGSPAWSMVALRMPHSPVASLLFLVLTGGAPLTGCKQASKPASAQDTVQAAKAPSYATLTPEQKHRVRIYQAHGRVLSVDRDHRQVTIAHQEIPGFMPAMTMTFSVRDGKLLDGISAGGKVDFALENTAETTVITRIREEAP